MASSSTVTSYLIYLVFIATFGPLQFGYHLGELNAPQKVITCQVDEAPAILSLNLPQCIRMDAGEWGLVQSIFTIGGLCGALLSGPISTKYGRLVAMRLLTGALFLGPVAEALAPTMAVMTAGRFIAGIGAGAATVVCPIYISEISPVEQRGLFGAFTQVMINMGILVAQVLGYFFSRDNLWRFILAAAGLIAVIEFVGLLWAPESPSWLAEHDHPAIALRILQRIRGADADIDEETKDWDMAADVSECSPLLASVHAPVIGHLRTPSLGHAPPVSFLDAVCLARHRRAVIAVTATMLAQQLCGINSVVMYSVSILGAIIPGAAALVTVLVSAINVVVTLVCAPLADRIGRKACLLLSIAGMGANSVLLAVALANDIPILSVVATLLFVASFAVGLGPVPFILASELAAPEAVGATQSWALAGNWLATFAVAQFFPILNHAMPRGRVYSLFAAIALVLGVFIAYWLPESNGKASAEEVWGDVVVVDRKLSR